MIAYLKGCSPSFFEIVFFLRATGLVNDQKRSLLEDVGAVWIKFAFLKKKLYSSKCINPENRPINYNPSILSEL